MFEEILNASPDAVLLVDAAGSISYANAASREVLGYTPEELVGQSIEQLVPPPLRRAHRESREKYQAAPWVRTMGKELELVTQHPDGRQVPVDIKLSPMGGQTLCIVRDAGERRAAETALRQLNEELRKLDSQRNRFLGILAHDLRSPLTVVRGYADLLLGRRMGTLGTEQREAVIQVRDSANLMLSLVNDLLDVTAIQEGALSLRLEPTRLVELVEKAVARHQILAAEKEQVIDFRSEVDEVELLLDPSRINQVLDNLLSNAVKYSPTGGRIRVGLAQEEGQFLLSVRDSGPGIPETHRDRLFQPYSPGGATPTGDETSVGLGLAIVHKIVLGHRGRVWFEPGAPGSVFHVALPD